MTMREDDTTGAYYVPPAVWDEPRGRTRVLLLVAGFLASLAANVIFLAMVARGGVR